jgi:hypothetical protein
MHTWQTVGRELEAPASTNITTDRVQQLAQIAGIGRRVTKR